MHRHPSSFHAWHRSQPLSASESAQPFPDHWPHYPGSPPASSHLHGQTHLSALRNLARSSPDQTGSSPPCAPHPPPWPWKSAPPSCQKRYPIDRVLVRGTALLSLWIRIWTRLIGGFWVHVIMCGNRFEWCAVICRGAFLRWFGFCAYTKAARYGTRDVDDRRAC
jgi:hypothetical protein